MKIKLPDKFYNFDQLDADLKAVVPTAAHTSARGVAFAIIEDEKDAAAVYMAAVNHDPTVKTPAQQDEARLQELKASFLSGDVKADDTATVTELLKLLLKKV